MLSNKLSAALLIASAAILIFSLSSSSLISSWTGGSSGNIAGVYASPDLRVYVNKYLWGELKSVWWGECTPGQNKSSKTYWLKSFGSEKLSLSIFTSNWSPINSSQYMICGWSLQNKTIAPNEVKTFNFWLYVKPTIRGIEKFGFDINLQGVEVQ